MLLKLGIGNFVDDLTLKERSFETIKGYKNVLKDFQRYIEGLLNGQVYVEDLTLDHLESYLGYRRNKGDQAVTRNRVMYIFRSYFKYMVRKGYVTLNVSLALEPVSAYQRERLYLLPSEVEQLIEAVYNPIAKAAIGMLAYTGLRVSELCHLTMEDVDLERGMVCVRKGKGNKDRIVPMNNRLKELLTTYIAEVRPMSELNNFFVTPYGKLSAPSINFHIKKAEALLNWHKKITAHILRHSFASTLVSSNASLPAIQALLGHSDLRVTSRYIHQNLQQLQEAVKLLDEPRR